MVVIYMYYYFLSISYHQSIFFLSINSWIPLLACLNGSDVWPSFLSSFAYVNVLLWQIANAIGVASTIFQCGVWLTFRNRQPQSPAATRPSAMRQSASASMLWGNRQETTVFVPNLFTHFGNNVHLKRSNVSHLFMDRQRDLFKNW
jgi:hypothetical protein